MEGINDAIIDDGNIDSHIAMLDGVKERLLEELADESDLWLKSKIESEFSKDKLPNLNEIFSDVDLEWKQLKFLSYGSSWKPLVVEYLWWLVHVVVVFNPKWLSFQERYEDCYLVFPDGTHSMPISFVKNIHVDENWVLFVNNAKFAQEQTI